MHTSKHLAQADFQPAIRPLFAQIIALTLSVIVRVKVFRFTDLLYNLHNKNATTQSTQFQAFCAVGRVHVVLCYKSYLVGCDAHVTPQMFDVFHALAERRRRRSLR